MGKYRALQNSFSVGQISPKLAGRSDLKQYLAACAKLQNFKVMPAGGLERRSGSEYIRDAYYRDNTPINRFIPYKFGSDETENYMLAMNLTVYSLVAPEHLHTRASMINSQGGNELLNISFTGAPAKNFLAAITASDYMSGNEDKIQYAQYGKWLFITCPDSSYPPVVIYPYILSTAPLVIQWMARPLTVFSGNTTASRGDRNLPICHNVPYSSVFNNLHSLVVGTGATTASLTTTVDVFKSEDVGRYMRFVSATLYGCGMIATYTDARNATITWYELSNSGGAAGTYYDWAFSDWGAEEGYPTTVAVSEGRVFWGGCTGKPDMIWASGVNNGLLLNSHRSPFSTNNIAYHGDKVVDDPFNSTIGSDSFNYIKWMINDLGLLVGSRTSEVLVNGGNAQIAYDNKQAAVHTNIGGYAVKPIKIDDGIAFVEASGTKIYKLAYSGASNNNVGKYAASNLTLLADEIIEQTIGEKVLQLAYQRTAKILWVLTTEKRLLSLTINTEATITAWSEHVMSGTDTINSIGVMDYEDVSGDVTIDQLFLATTRTIDGSAVQMLEKLGQDAYLDCHKTVTGVSALVWGGFLHLMNEEVTVIADDYKIYTLTVSATGEITLPVAATKVVAGYNYESIVQTMPLEKGQSFETVQGALGRIDRAIVRVLRSLGGTIGYEEDKMVQLLGNPINADVLTEDKITAFPQGPQRKSYVIVKQDQPLPMTILSIIMKGMMNDFD